MENLEENKNLDGQENEDIIIEDIVEDDIEQSGQNQTVESGDDTTEGGEKDEKQSNIDKKINKFYAEKRAAEEKAEAERLRRKELEKKLAEATKEVIPDVPTVPDPLDPEYEFKVAEREAILKKHWRQEEAERIRKENEERTAKEVQLAEQERINGIVKSFGDNTVSLKLDKASVDKASEMVGAAIMGNQPLIQFLLEDEAGPLNVLYLSQNAEELDKVSKMPATQAAVYIATQITPKSAGLKPKQSSAPEPPYSPKGGRSKVQDEHPELEGCTFT